MNQTPPLYEEVPQTPRAKLMPGNTFESHQHLLPPSSPNLMPSKLDGTSFDDFRRMSSSPSPCPSPIPMGYLSHNAHLPTETPQSKWKKLWVKNKPAAFVALSQFFGALMNLSARLLELEGDGMHPVQALLIRHSVTALFCSLYMWWNKTPDFPFGKKEIRWLLWLRGASGFWGIFGVWYAMMYISLADATVITFLAPGVAGIICWFVLREPFTRIEQLATLVAFMGVVLIARPTSLFSQSDDGDDHSSKAEPSESGGIPGADHEATPEERLIAVGVALFGVLGAAGAFTTLRTIGKRAHPLISVNYFGVISTFISLFILIFAPILDIQQPALRWVTPTTAKQWILLLPLGILGFIMQYFLTASLGADKSNRANSMVYTHMLFAAGFDRWVFGHRMGLMSGAGCTLILGSAIGVVMLKKPLPPKAPLDDVERHGNLDGELEGSPMLLSDPGASEELRLSR
ncbi:integral membrane protein [Fusarium heterosporum]|uniref:Integral membrane protein n=1 Tax=Fusarium heterosporum TaxID=42747 RepID=A0A8H5SWS7_FUSHE|nr:integral membrane protein [Fusarium heterosporum]